ncbi:IS1 family transposase [Capnocytophaga canimorsus]|uniref:IS1 family transposase n=1 Tax=Capnocytophaga canimorsus TaxID=28188 RepID=UPI0037CDCFFD
MDCPICKSKNKIKNGIIKGVQRYKCKDCGRNYTVAHKSTAKLPSQRRLGLMMYLEGLSFHSIGRILGVSHVAVMNWVKKYGSQLEEIKNEKPISVVEIDELHSYLQSKKYCWIWIAVDREGKRYLDFVVGNRGTETGLKLWERINQEETKAYCTDYWKSYKEFIPAEKHVQTKAETYTVESYNSRIRHYLARFRRKTKCYTKQLYMMIYSLKLLMLKLNNEPSILNY